MLNKGPFQNLLLDYLQLHDSSTIFIFFSFEFLDFCHVSKMFHNYSHCWNALQFINMQYLDQEIILSDILISYMIGKGYISLGKVICSTNNMIIMIMSGWSKGHVGKNYKISITCYCTGISTVAPCHMQVFSLQNLSLYPI